MTMAELTGFASSLGGIKENQALIPEAMMQYLLPLVFINLEKAVRPRKTPKPRKEARR
ncbi:hypothetical protein [Propionivibrio sp.]|uniref:hypothetical protein n=1 Tax=Propionivibrio sp. TaxID=2212460 RepID=UPI003BF0BDC9